MYGLGDVRFFDRIAPLYDRVMPPADGETLAAGLDHATRPIDRLLDIGGGSGRAAAALTGPDITVVDASLGMLARAREHRGLSGVAGDAGRLPFRDGSVDAAMVVDAFHHLPDQAAAIGEAARVIAPGGALVIGSSTRRTRSAESSSRASTRSGWSRGSVPQTISPPRSPTPGSIRGSSTAASATRSWACGSEGESR